MLMEQHSSSGEVSGGIPSSRRLLMFAKMDLWAQTEVSPSRRLAAWVALSITVAITMILLVGISPG
jgi:hypothetical protein